MNPAIRNLSYDITDLYNFIDGLADMSALVYVPLSHSKIMCMHSSLIESVFFNLILFERQSHSHSALVTVLLIFLFNGLTDVES